MTTRGSTQFICVCPCICYILNIKILIQQQSRDMFEKLAGPHNFQGQLRYGFIVEVRIGFRVWGLVGLVRVKIGS